MTNDKYCNMINAVDSKLAEIKDIIKSYFDKHIKPKNLILV